MTQFQTLTMAAALTLIGGLAATSAQAVTVTLDIGGASAASDINLTNTPGGALIDADWFAAPADAFLDFTVDGVFDIVLNSFNIINGATSDVTGLIVEQLDGPGPIGSVVSVLTNDTTFCGSSIFASSSSCDLITSATTTGGSTGIASRPGDTVLADLPAGSYRLAYFDSASPEEADFQLEIQDAASTAVVPLPAGLPLLAGALGAAALVRRRKA